MTHYSLVQTLRPDRPARYSANGKRISRDEFERITNEALRNGSLCCLQTRAWQLPGGEFLRKNYSQARA